MGICVAHAVQMSAFALIAWFCIKKRGGFPFELAGCFALGAIVVSKTAAVHLVHILIPWLLGGVSALSLEILSGQVSTRIGLNRDVFGMIFALAALVVFDFLTDSSPISVLYPGTSLFITGTLLSGIVMGFVYHIVSGTRGARLRLGTVYKWASDAWLRGSSDATTAIKTTALLAWTVVLAVPMSTTGVATQTIFRDTTLAILIAKAVTLHHALWLPVIALFVAAARTATAYALAGPFGSVAADLSVIVLLSTIIGIRAKRRDA